MAAALEAAKELEQATSELHDSVSASNFANTANSSAGPTVANGCHGLRSRPVHGHFGQVGSADQAGGHRRQRKRSADKVAETCQQGKPARPRQRSIAEFLQVGKLVKLERLQQEQGRPGPVEATGGHAHDLCATTGAPKTPPTSFSSRTDVTPSLAVTSYNIGQSWKQAKTSNPESLKHPLRAILFQHLMTSMTSALENLLSDPQKVEQAKTLGWIQGEDFTGMKWNAEKKVHETDPNVPPIPIPQTLNLILEATKLCTEPFAINRYHAMRPLASEYSSPTLTMMLEIGLRTAEANRLWSIFNNIAQTSVWLAVGAYCRHERLQRSALANRLAQGTSN